MKQRPKDFWITTPCEFATLLDGFSGQAKGEEPITRKRLQELMEKHPDV